MCGIAGIVGLGQSLPRLPEVYFRVFDRLLNHRGPDGSGVWMSEDSRVLLTHFRLAILDTSPAAAQPMSSTNGRIVSFNGEIYNYRELREVARQRGWNFRTDSDTEVLLAVFEQHGIDAFRHLRGMFAAAIWDGREDRLVLARDRFGVKPLYYYKSDKEFVFASEMKALLPFLPAIRTNPQALTEYLTFNYGLSEQTMFEGVLEVPPGHVIEIQDGKVRKTKYWDLTYQVNHRLSVDEITSQLLHLLEDSVSAHLRSDVEVGAYVSGGLDSSLIYGIANDQSSPGLKGFHGRFHGREGFDESDYAIDAVSMHSGNLYTKDIKSSDFVDNIRRVIYHLDQPVAGPGAFPQFMTSELARQHVKVILGGQGGDEIFGGYARYLIAYFEQCIKAAIDGTYRNGNFVVTIESIVPNLGTLREYKPLLQDFWREGLFGPLDQRFLRLIDRSHDMKNEIDWSQLDLVAVHDRFYTIFNNRRDVEKESYFDSMTHYETKTLLPALLQVEDRMSMAHGVESRVPFLDHHLVEFMATVPADVKFKDGQLKHLLRTVAQGRVPSSVIDRRDKMGFPVPLNDWFNNELSGFVREVFAETRSKNRPFVNVDAIENNQKSTGMFSRTTWALLSLELWQQQFHDRAHEYRSLLI